jgi:hypothetical protein
MLLPGTQPRDYVALRQAGERRVLGSSHSIRQMTVGACKEIRLPAVRDNIRHRRMPVRMPVWRREPIDGLRQRESRCAVRDAMQPRAIRDCGITWAAGESPEWYVSRILERSDSDGEDGDDYRQDGRQGT